jgi:hypothetical protein
LIEVPAVFVFRRRQNFFASKMPLPADGRVKIAIRSKIMENQTIQSGGSDPAHETKTADAVSAEPTTVRGQNQDANPPTSTATGKVKVKVGQYVVGNGNNPYPAGRY